MIYIYGKSIKRKKLIYFLQYKRQVTLLKNQNVLLNNKKKVHQRLFNDLKNKEDIKDILYQKYLLEESKKYTYFPSINRYNLILEKYYLIKDIPNISYNTERIKKYKSKLDPNTLTSNMKKIPYQNRLLERAKLINKNKSFSAINKSKSINFFSKKNINVNNRQNSAFKNSFYNSISKEKLSPIIPDSIKAINKKSIKILQLKNTIPHNFKKKMIKTESNHKAHKSFLKSKMNKDSQKSLYNNMMNKTNVNKSKETNNSLTNKRSNSYQNTEILSEEKSTNIHSKKNTLSLKNISLNENSNNKYIINNKIVHNMDSTIFDSNRKSGNNSYMNLLNVNRGRSSHLISIKYRPSNNLLGADNNSVSTNFIDRNSQIDNYNSIIKENNQHSFFYYKFNRNTSYLFSKGNKNINIDSINNENIKNKTDIKTNASINNKRGENERLHLTNQISEIKKCESNKIEKNNLDEIFKEISIHYEDNNNNRIQKNDKILSIIPTKIDLNNIENEADFNIISERNEDKNEILDQYKISSNVVNENVNNSINEDNNIRMSISEKSEPTTIQSMDDSKILEMANQLLNQEDTVDRIKIYDILSSKKNKI